MKTDLHMHSSFSGDCDTPMELMIQEAVRQGLATICFTEHMDIDYPPIECDFNLDIKGYRTHFLKMKETYADRIELLFGMEFGMQPHLAGKCQSLADSYSFDMIIASQHLLHGDDPYYPAMWVGKDPKEMIREYYVETFQNLKSMTAFDTLAHLDYIVRYSSEEKYVYRYCDYAEYVDPILKYLIESGKALEVNAGGFRHGCGQPNPNMDTLLRYQELGGELITVGSDGHKPESMIQSYPQIRDFLREAGFQYHFVYRNRTAYPEKL